MAPLYTIAIMPSYRAVLAIGDVFAGHPPDEVIDSAVALDFVRRHAPHAFQQALPTPDEDVLAQVSIDDPLFDPSAPVILDGYALLVPLGEISEAAGGLEIRVMEAEWVPPIIAAHSNS